jgi:hypothetical protein
MLGKTIPCGPGGSGCACCYSAPGKARKREKRAAKRREKREVLSTD